MFEVIYLSCVLERERGKEGERKGERERERERDLYTLKSREVIDFME